MPRIVGKVFVHVEMNKKVKNPVALQPANELPQPGF